MWMVCCWQLIASNIPAVNTRVKMERIASNIARCGCPFKASASQADIQRFEPHLGHFGLPLAQTTMAKLAISRSGWLSHYAKVEYLQSLPEETRTITFSSLSRFKLYD